MTNNDKNTKFLVNSPEFNTMVYSVLEYYCTVYFIFYAEHGVLYTVQYSTCFRNTVSCICRTFYSLADTSTYSLASSNKSDSNLHVTCNNFP